MSLVPITGLWYPEPFFGSANATLDTTNMILDAAGEAYGFIFPAPKTGKLWKIGFRTGTVVNNQTVRASLQGVDSSGNPDGTPTHYRDVAVATNDDSVFKLSGILSSDGTDLGTLKSVNKTEPVALVLEHNPFNSGDVLRVTTIGMTSRAGMSAQRYSLLKTGGSWAKQVATYPNIVLLYDDGTAYYIPGVLPAVTFSSPGYNSGTSSGGDERGNRIVIPFKCTVDGWYANGALNSGADFDVVLYGADGNTVLTSMSQSSVNQAWGTGAGWWGSQFATSPVLNAGDTVYLTWKPTTTTNVFLSSVSVSDPSHLGQLGGGTTVQFAAKTDGGAFAVTNTQRSCLGLILSAVDDGAAAGGTGFIGRPEVYYL